MLFDLVAPFCVCKRLLVDISHYPSELYPLKKKKKKVFHVVEGSNKAIYLRKLYFQQANLEDLKGRLLGFNQNLSYFLSFFPTSL